MPDTTIIRKREKSKNISKRLQKTKKGTKKFTKRTKHNDNDTFITYLDDMKFSLTKGKILAIDDIETYILKTDKNNCICENIFKEHVAGACKCENLKDYEKQGLSGAEIHQIKCNILNQQNKPVILKTVEQSNYYIKHSHTSKKYYFLEADRFTQQVLINNYCNKYLPDNTVKYYESGICIKDDVKMGYILMELADCGSGEVFLKDIFANKMKFTNSKLQIDNPEHKYKIIVNFFLQVILTLGHLQQSPIALFHGDLKLENYFVKSCDVTNKPFFTFKINGRTIRIRNIGFAVLITDFDLSSISLRTGKPNEKDFRITPPLKFPFLLEYWRNNLLKYANTEPNDLKNSYGKTGVKLENMPIINWLPSKLNPSISVYRAVGSKYFQEIDLYLFIVKTLHEPHIREFILKNKLEQSLLAFINPDVFKEILNLKLRFENSVNWAFSNLVSIMDKTGQYLRPVFTDEYINNLKQLNYKLFEKI